MSKSSVKVVQLFLGVALLAAMASVPAYADPINIYVNSGTVTFNATGSGGQYMSIANLLMSSGDLSGKPISISPGAGTFNLNSVSGGVGYFAPLNGATVTLGNSSTGIVTGTISMIEIDLGGKAESLQGFTLALEFTNLHFQACSTLNCSNSSTLMEFAMAPYGDALLNFSFQKTTAANVAGLYDLTGRHSSSMSGELDADSTVTPESASLALFGTGLLVCGFRIYRPRKQLKA